MVVLTEGLFMCMDSFTELGWVYLYLGMDSRM